MTHPNNNWYLWNLFIGKALNITECQSILFRILNTKRHFFTNCLKLAPDHVLMVKMGSNLLIYLICLWRSYFQIVLLEFVLFSPFRGLVMLNCLSDIRFVKYARSSNCCSANEELPVNSVALLTEQNVLISTAFDEPLIGYFSLFTE